MPDDLPLGHPTGYPTRYDPQLLCAVPRATARTEIGVSDPLPFHGVDVWNAYEVSWLDANGKPIARTARLHFPATAPHIIESKSLKLYLHSLNQTRQAGEEEVKHTLRADLGEVAGAALEVELFPVTGPGAVKQDLPGDCIDDLEITVDRYELDPGLLRVAADADTDVDGNVEETLHSHVLKTHCPITNQPDWGSISIHYLGPRIDREGLLRYLISYRTHREFHELCVERMFMDLQRRCRPRLLTVLACFTRRGGLDINPFRSNFEACPTGLRLWRQ